MRETRDCCLLMELAKGVKSTTATKTIAISCKLGDSVGKVLQLDVQKEIFDLDAASSADMVLQKPLKGRWGVASCDYVI